MESPNFIAVGRDKSSRRPPFASMPCRAVIKSLRTLLSTGDLTRTHRADYADTAGNISGGVGASKMHFGYAAVTQAVFNMMNTVAQSNAAVWDVHTYALASPIICDNLSTANTVIVVPQSSKVTANAQRRWGFFAATPATGSQYFGNCSCGWHYLTNSGDPSFWVQADDNGNLLAVWEAEDPIDPFVPDLPPMEGAIKVKIPTISYIDPLLDKVLQDAAKPSWLDYSVFKEIKTPQELFNKLLGIKLEERALFSGMEHNEQSLSVNLKAGLKEFVLDQTKEHTLRDWRMQMILRTLEQIMYERLPSTQSAARIIIDNFNADMSFVQCLLRRNLYNNCEIYLNIYYYLWNFDTKKIFCMTNLPT